MNTGGIREMYNREGWFVVHGLFDDARCDNWAAAIDEKLCSGEGQQRFFPGGPNKFSEFWDLICDQELIGVLQHVLGEQPKYLLVGDLHANHNAHQWHRDFALPGADDRVIAFDDDEEPFSIIKLAVYVDPGHCGLTVVPGSTGKPIPRYFGLDVYDDAYLTDPDGSQRAISEGIIPPKIIQAGKGDVVGFDPRIYHAGCFVDPLTGRPRRDITVAKKNVFLSYGIDGYWSRKYTSYYHDFRMDLLYDKGHPDFLRKLSNLNLLAATPDYDPETDFRWFKEHMISPPCFGDGFASGAVVGSSEWYEELGDNFASAGHAFSAARVYDAAITSATEHLPLDNEENSWRVKKSGKVEARLERLFVKSALNHKEIGKRCP